MRLNKRVSTAIPETAGRDMMDHCSLVTVQGGQIRHLHYRWNIMCPSHMIDTVLSSALSHRTPRYRASPQLRELHVIQGNMSAQILLYMFTTGCTSSRLCGTKPLPTVLAHLIQIKLISRHERKQSLRSVQAKASKFA